MKKYLILLVSIVSLLGMSGVARAAIPTDWIVGSYGDAWVGNVTFDNTTVDYENAKLLNGYNPAHLYWVTSSGGNPNALNATDKKQAQRFTAPANKTVRKIGFFWIWGHAIATPTYRIGLQYNNLATGYPNGTWVNNSTGTVNTGATGGNWYYVQLSGPVDIVKGQIYHIVVEYDSGSIGGASNYRSEIMANVPSGDKIALNTIGPDKNINVIDSNMQEETYSNANGWQASPTGVLTWLLDFTDDTYYGNPLNHGYASLSNKADVYFREYFEIDLQNKTVEKVSSMLGVTPEHWTGGASDANWARLGDVEYEIKNASGAMLRSGVLATKNQIRDQYENLTYYAGDRRFAWYEANLSSPLTLEKDKGYYLELFSPNTTPEPRYTCDAPNIRPWVNTSYSNAGPSFISLMTYDGSSSYFERWDVNSGAIWKQDGYQRDVSFKLKLIDVYKGDITSITKDAESIGSAGDVWKQIKHVGSVPSGTSIDIEVNSSSCGGFVTVQDNAVSGTTYDLPSCAQERYVSWRLILHTEDPSITPEIYNVTLIAAPNEGLSPIDINQDGTIDISDLRLVALHFGESTTPPYPRYDVDANGTVDILDLRQVAGGM